MTPDDVRAAAERLVDFHERFAPLFGKEQAQDHAYDYVKGLMVCPERKSIEPIALHGRPRRRLGPAEVRQHRPLGVTTTSRPRSRPSSPTSWSPRPPARPVGVVGVIDESGLRQEGRRTRAGVARQHNGRLGKEDNCQVGVFLVGVTPGGVGAAGPPALPARALVRGHARGRRTAASKAHIPEGVAFRTKPRIAAELIRRRRGAGQSSTWTGSSPTRSTAGTGDFLDEMETLEQRYVVEVPVDDDGLDRGPGRRASRRTAVGASRRRGRRGRRSRSRWPRWPRACPPRRGRPLQVREGAKRPAGLRVRGGAGLGGAAPQAGAAGLAADPPVAGGRRPRSSTTSPTATPRRRWRCWRWWPARRHRVEEFFEDAKSYLGMAQYETRS